MNPDTRKIFKEIATGEVIQEIFEFEDKQRELQFRAAANVVAEKVLKYQAALLGKTRFQPGVLFKIDFENVFANAQPEVEKLNMSKGESYFFAHLIFTELMKGYPKAEA